jgi:heme/copper-type cytochrome/quinol oxidase subunit 2
VYQVTILPSILLIITGISLFAFLLYVIGFLDTRHLKKQKKTKLREKKSKKVYLVIFYVISIISIILLACFLVEIQI